MSAAPGRHRKTHGEVVSRNGKHVSRNGKPVPHTHNTPRMSFKQRIAKSDGYVKEISDELKKYKPNIRNVLAYYFNNFESLERSGYKRSEDYDEFLNTFRAYFFPERITSWHWNGTTCVDSGPRGAHKSYREFLSYIVRNVETFNPLQYTRIILLLTRFEEAAIGRKTYIENNKDNNEILLMFMKYGVNKKNDGEYEFCKERTVMTNGIAINNLKVIRLLREVFRSRFPDDAADDDSYNYDSEDDSDDDDSEDDDSEDDDGEDDDDGGGGDPRGMEAAEGGRNRSRRAPIRRKSANRRTSRRRNKTRKYYKK